MDFIKFAIAAMAALLFPTIGISQTKAIDRWTNSSMNEFERAAAKDIGKFCANKWPSDYDMQNYCYEQNVKARDHAQSYDLINGEPELMGIWSSCASKWTDQQDLTDWQMMNYCMTRQVEALKKIKNRQGN